MPILVLNVPGLELLVESETASVHGEERKTAVFDTLQKRGGKALGIAGEQVDLFLQIPKLSQQPVLAVCMAPRSTVRLRPLRPRHAVTSRLGIRLQ